MSSKESEYLSGVSWSLFQLSRSPDALLVLQFLMSPSRQVLVILDCVDILGINPAFIMIFSFLEVETKFTKDS